jgi:hypothetical protein
MLQTNEKLKKNLKQSVEAMKPALQEAFKEIRRRLAGCTARDVLARYRVAELVKKVQEGDGKRTYGTSAIISLAGALGQSEQSLRNYAAVAETWTEYEIKEILHNKNAYGARLSWSHFILLANITSPEERQRRIEEILEKSLSVRELKRDIEQNNRSAANPSVTTAHNIRQGLSQMVAQAEILARHSESWNTAVFKQFASAKPAELTESLQNELQRAKDKQLEAMHICKANAEQLAECLKHVKSRRTKG